MAENDKGATPKANTAVPQARDRVAALSVRADGTHDQLNPEFLVDSEAAREYTRRQFAEQAVGGADDANRGAGGPVTIIGRPGDEPDEVVPATSDAVRQDPSVAERQAQHEKAVKAAERAADAVVDELAPKKG